MGDTSVVAALYGPLVLAAELGAGPVDGPARIVHGRPTEPADLPKPDPLPTVAASPDSDVKHWIQVESPAELRFAVAGESANIRCCPCIRLEISVTPSTGR